MISNQSNKDWFALCAKEQQELSVSEYLGKLGVDACAPIKIDVKVDLIKKVDLNLFLSSFFK